MAFIECLLMGNSEINMDAWPHNKEIGQENFSEIPWVFSKIITTLSKVQISKYLD